MRKHHKRWVALFSAAAISTTGLMGVSGTAVADDKDSRTLNWPLISQGVSTYSLDGYEIGYLPPGLERYGISASSTTDRQGNQHSQISWTQGPDQLYGRVTVVRSEAFQELDDLRQSRYGHLPTGELERLEKNEAFADGAYLAEESGDLFWLEEPGVAVTTHLQPDRWGGNELVKFATSVEASEVEGEVEEAAEAENASADAEDGAVVEPVADPPQAEEAPAEEAPAEEAPAEEAPAEETPAEDVPAEEAPAAEAPVEEAPAEEAPAEEAPADDVPAEEAPAAEAPVEEPAPETEAPAEEAPAEEAPEAPVEEAPDAEAPAEEAPAEEAPVEEAPTEEAPDAEAPAEEVPAEEAPDAEAPAEEAPAEETADAAASRQVKECLIDQFVDFGSGETVLDTESLTPDSGAFVEQALTKGDLNDAERDRLLATVWYYGAEDQKTAATSECAEANGMDKAEVEAVLAEVADQIAALVQEAEAAMTEGMDQVSQTVQEGDTTEQAEIDPVDAQEWQELWESLPWSIPAEADTSGS